MKNPFAAIAALSFLLLLGGAADAQTSRSGKMQAGKATLNAMDRTFMKMAAQGNIAEIKISELALKKSQNEAVRKVADEIIREHSAAQKQLKQVAAQKGVSLPSDTDPMHKAMYSKLAKLSGAAFDRQYIAGQIKDHDKTIQLFQRQLKGGRDASVNDFAARTLPAITKHAEHIRQVAPSVGVGGKMGRM